MPPQARLFAVGAGSRSYDWPGEVGAATAFFDAEMPRRGYRAVSRRDGAGTVRQVWEGDHGRVLLRLQRVLGRMPGTRIRIVASARPAADAPPRPPMSRVPDR